MSVFRIEHSDERRNCSEHCEIRSRFSIFLRQRPHSLRRDSPHREVFFEQLLHHSLQLRQCLLLPLRLRIRFRLRRVQQIRQLLRPLLLLCMASHGAEVSNVSFAAATLAIAVAGGAAAADGIEDQAAKHAEVAASSGIFLRVSVVESDGSNAIPVTVCHSPATYIGEREREREREGKR
ncbi:hypothetical protein V8G54_006279, partial [Vigna mungo]